MLKNSVRRGTQTLTDVFDITHDIDGFLPSNDSLGRTINLVPRDFPIFLGKSPGDEGHLSYPILSYPRLKHREAQLPIDVLSLIDHGHTRHCEDCKDVCLC